MIDWLSAGFGLVFGGITGVISTSLLQKKADRIFQGFYARYRVIKYKFIEKKYLGELFSIKGISTGVHIIEGDGYLRYDSDSLRLMLRDTPEFPYEIAAKRAEVEKREEDKKRNGIEPHWNGPQLGLLRYQVGRTKNEDFLTLSADVYRSDYFSFLATCGELIEEHRLGSSYMYDTYIRDKPYGQPVGFLAGGVGVVVALMTSDHRLVAGRRTRTSGVRGRDLDLCIAESINPDVDVGTNRFIDPWLTAIRGVHEEIGVTPKRDNIDMVGFAVDTICHQFNFVAICRLEITSTELIALRGRGTAGKWELDDIHTFGFGEQEVRKALNLSSNWGFGVLCLYWAAKSEMSSRVFEKTFP